MTLNYCDVMMSVLGICKMLREPLFIQKGAQTFLSVVFVAPAFKAGKNVYLPFKLFLE